MAVKHKRTSTASYSWQASDLAEGQIGLNIADGTLHFKKTNNTIVSIAPGPGVPDGGTTGQVLAKASDGNQDTEWVTVQVSGGGETFHPFLLAGM